MSMFDNYEKPTKGNRYLKEIDPKTGVVVRLLQAPVFAWKDLAFEPAVGDEKAKKVIEDYFPYTDPKKRPVLTKRPDIKRYKSTDARYASHVWACLAFNQDLKEVQYFEIDKTDIMDGLVATDKSGYNLLDTDIKITRTETVSNGKKSNTYAVVPLPPNVKQELPPNIGEMITDLNIDLNRIFTSGNPFQEIDDIEFVNSDGTAFNPNQTVDTPDLPDPAQVVNELPEIDLNEISTPF